MSNFREQMEATFGKPVEAKPKLGGNGAPEALIEQLEIESEKADGENDTLLVDRLLAGLWLKGFKIVPIVASEPVE